MTKETVVHLPPSNSQPSFVATKRGKATLFGVIITILLAITALTICFTYGSPVVKVESKSNDLHEVNITYSGILKKYSHETSLVQLVSTVDPTSNWWLFRNTNSTPTLVNASEKIHFGGSTKWSVRLVFFDSSKLHPTEAFTILKSMNYAPWNPDTFPPFTNSNSNFSVIPQELNENVTLNPPVTEIKSVTS